LAGTLGQRRPCRAVQAGPRTKLAGCRDNVADIQREVTGLVGIGCGGSPCPGCLEKVGIAEPGGFKGRRPGRAGCGLVGSRLAGEGLAGLLVAFGCCPGLEDAALRAPPGTHSTPAAQLQHLLTVISGTSSVTVQVLATGHSPARDQPALRGTGLRRACRPIAVKPFVESWILAFAWQDA
jgi:hypothetical protein